MLLDKLIISDIIYQFKWALIGPNISFTVWFDCSKARKKRRQGRTVRRVSGLVLSFYLSISLLILLFFFFEQLLNCFEIDTQVSKRKVRDLLVSFLYRLKTEMERKEKKHNFSQQKETWVPSRTGKPSKCGKKVSCKFPV